MEATNTIPFVAIACGGTGGHLFPGLAVGEELLHRNCDVALLISPKEVDQQAVKAARDMEVITLPAVALNRGNFLSFAAGFWKSYRTAKEAFRKRHPNAVLAMGGFTSAPPVIAAKHLGARAFLHESNSIPGRANRWLAHFVDDAFVYFSEASGQLNLQRIHEIGMPVRSQFLDPIDVASARMAVGLDAKQPVLLIMGGSQGASGVNKMVIDILPLLTKRLPQLQYIHLTGQHDTDKIRDAYAAHKAKAIVRPFLTEMELAMSAATAAISRAGASSLAEIAAMRLPSILVPYPHAADDHQSYNALAFVGSGAARTIEQTSASPELLLEQIVELIEDETIRSGIQQALNKWHTPGAAGQIADHILRVVAAGEASTQPQTEKNLGNTQTSSPRHTLLARNVKEAKCST